MDQAKDAYELLARFSYRPVQLKKCGIFEAHKLLYDYILAKKGPEQIRAILPKFPTMWPYIEQLSAKNKKEGYEIDYDTAEAYWLGNELLDRCSFQDLKTIISKNPNLNEQSLTYLINNIPEDAIPHHSFNVLYLGSSLENMDKCLITWGKVKEIYEHELIVSYRPLQLSEGYYLGDSIDKKVLYDSKLLPDIAIGDSIAMHWDFAVKKLDTRELSNLEKYTLRNIAAVNSNRI
jgi:hypothetical protein